MSFRNAPKKLVGPYIQAAGKQAEAAAATSHQQPDVIDQEASKSTERADTENEKHVDAFSHDVCKSISSASVKSLEHKETLNQKVVGAVGSTAIQAKEWVTEHPYQTVGIAVGVAAVPISIACTPLALATAGFGAAGVQGGKFIGIPTWSAINHVQGPLPLLFRLELGTL